MAWSDRGSLPMTDTAGEAALAILEAAPLLSSLTGVHHVVLHGVVDEDGRAGRHLRRATPLWPEGSKSCLQSSES